MKMKSTCKSIAMITAIVMILTMFASFAGHGQLQAYAATETKVNKTGTVIDGPLNIRSGPGTEYKTIGSLAKGKTITVLTSIKDKKGSSWYKFKASSSKYGYVSATYVKLKSTPTKDTVKTFVRKGRVPVSTLKVRSGPGTEYPQTGTLKKGNGIITDKMITKPSGAVWYQFTHKGKVYFVNAKYIKLTNIVSETAVNRTGVVVDGPLNVRSGAGTDFKSLGKIGQGKAITVVTKIKNTKGEYWYSYKCTSSKYGFLSAKYVELQDIVSNFVLKAYTNNATYVYSSADAKASKLGSLKKSTAVFIKKKVIKPDNSIWYQIEYNARDGYIHSKYLTMTNIVKEKAADTAAYVKDGPLNVRSGPGASYKVTASLAEYTPVTIKAEVLNTAGETWYYIKHDKGSGYVSASYIKIGKPNTVSFYMGTVTTDSGVTLNVRSGPGTGYGKIGYLTSGTVVTVKSSKTGTNKKAWYSFDYAGKEGWVCSDYMKVKKVTSSAAFESYMKEQGFPESYKPALRALNQSHPGWVFKAYNVGCSWNTAVAAENRKPGINVVSSSAPKSYRSKDKDCYNSRTGSWSRYDGGWYSAHTDVIEYYMDPRNFLNETGIYQFMTHKYDGDTQNEKTVSAIAKGTFLESRIPRDGSGSFAKIIATAGAKSGVNPNVMTAMIIQEQGTKGTSGSISGKVSGYTGYYNFFNIGAWTTDTMSAVTRGLWYAKQQGWNSEYKSILGGAKQYYNDYVKRNQYTFYTKKFNVMNGASQIGVHQYMTNVQGAYGEGLQLKKAYTSGHNEAITFLIPVYSSMPSAPCQLP